MSWKTATMGVVERWEIQRCKCKKLKATVRVLCLARTYSKEKAVTNIGHPSTFRFLLACIFCSAVEMTNPAREMNGLAVLSSQASYAGYRTAIPSSLSADLSTLWLAHCLGFFAVRLPSDPYRQCMRVASIVQIEVRRMSVHMNILSLDSGFTEITWPEPSLLKNFFVPKTDSTVNRTRAVELSATTAASQQLKFHWSYTNALNLRAIIFF